MRSKPTPAELAAEVEPQDLDDPGPGEPPEEPVSRPGDLWLLGDHRLLCGDSTSAEDLSRLMAGEKAVLLATDPPYLVDYQGGNHPQSWHNRPETKDRHWDHYREGEGFEFFIAWLRCALEHVVPDSAIYQWHATRRQTLVERAWQECGLLVHQTIVWVKARPVLTSRPWRGRKYPRNPAVRAREQIRTRSKAARCLRMVRPRACARLGGRAVTGRPRSKFSRSSRKASTVA